MRKTFLTKSEQETQGVAQNFAKNILMKKNKNPVFLALEGDLGTGKTIFLKGLARGLGIKKRITSPTFVIIKKYNLSPKTSKFSQYRTFFHIDCYRIKNYEDLLDLGWSDIIRERAIIAVEWADRIKKIIPSDATKIRLKVVDENRRKIVIWG